MLLVERHIEDKMGKAMTLRRRKTVLAAVLTAGAVCVLLFNAISGEAVPSHLDRSKNREGCAACHKGHGKRGTPMLNAPRQDFCFGCHGMSGERSQGRKDVYSVFRKRYRHPVIETSQYHIAGETLPETLPSTPRHVACQDCHNVHRTEPGNEMKRVKGHRRGRRGNFAATAEYEVCYRCHSESANLPPGQHDIADDFDSSNLSFHPVESRGRNHSVPSLKSPYNVASRVDCSSCHGNNDSFGARGPHGSDYEHLLSGRYTKTQTAESPSVHELCYSCHERQSILADESFQRHRMHVVFLHIPCSACHAPHGSRYNPHLISFDTRSFVDSAPMPGYVPAQAGKPMCYLKCHVGGAEVIHDAKFYKDKKWP